MNREDLYRAATDYFGISNRQQKTVEECAELIVAISHYREGRASHLDVAEELADVIITTGNLRQIIGPGLVDQVVRAKCARLEALLAESHESQG